jgi:hypothetical protein
MIRCAAPGSKEREEAIAAANDIMDFQSRVMDRSGLSPESTYLPPSIHPGFTGHEPKTGELKLTTFSTLHNTRGAIHFALSQELLQSM